MGEVTYTDFPFKTQPYKHQHDAWKVSKDRKVYAYFMEMGTGKTKVALDNAAYLFLNGKIDAQVIVAPKGVYMNWVENEIPTHMSDAVKYKVGFWSSYPRKDEREAVANLHKEGNFLRTFVMNVEAMNSEKAVDELFFLLKRFRCFMVVDESTTIKNPNAKRTKILINAGKMATYKRICTGNPIPNGPLDLYSQADFLQQNLLGFGNYYSFRNRFAVLSKSQFGKQSFQAVVGYRDLEVLQGLMDSFSFIIKKADCLDLPPKVYQTVDVEMGPRQKDAYTKMTQDAIIMLEGAQVTAPIVMTQLLRLHQISCGFLKPDGMDEVPFGEPNERLETLLDILSQVPGKVIIWATYQYNIRQILRGIAGKFGEESVVSYFGETDDDDRRKAKKLFQDPESPVRFMVSNPDTGKWGNTWTQATTVIYYSNNYNLEAREQSEDRAHRIGQVGALHSISVCEDGPKIKTTNPSVLYIDLRARGTVDDRIIAVLKNKKKLTDEIVQSNWRWLITGIK